MLGMPSVAILLAALVLVPAAFLYFAVKMGLTPLNAVCLALLSSTIFSIACWSMVNGPAEEKARAEALKKDFAKQMIVIEEQLKAQDKNSEEVQDALQLFKDSFNNVAEKAVVLATPTFFFICHMGFLGIAYLLGTWLAPRFGKKLEPLPAFKEWRFNWNLIWLYIGGWLMFYGFNNIPSFPGLETIRIIGANCFVMSNILYCIAGFSLLFFFYDKYKIGSFTRVGLTLIALIFAQFLIWLGVIDVWAEFRTRKSPPRVSDDSDDHNLDY